METQKKTYIFSDPQSPAEIRTEGKTHTKDTKKEINKEDALLLWFSEVNSDDVKYVGGKNASLGEMFQQLVPKGVNVPNGFAVTSKAYFHFLETAKIDSKLRQLLDGVDINDTRDLENRGQKVRMTILKAKFPPELTEAITEAYHRLEAEYNEDLDVAVRSSATAEDLPEASFAGQQESFLNIRGVDSLLYTVKRCMASLFTNRAIAYRISKNFDHFKVGISVGVQKMVRSDKASSGVMFSLDTETGFKDVVLINAAWGLGENVVQGAVNPDEYLVFKPTLQKFNKRAIIRKNLGSKKLKMVYNSSGGTKNTKTAKEERDSFCLTDDEIIQLSRWAITIEEHYSARKGKLVPMDMEWAKDGISNELFIVQSRPETVHSQKDLTKMKVFVLKEKGKQLVTGVSVGNGIGAGRAHIIKDKKHMHDFKTYQDGEVLVTSMTDPDWEPVLHRAKAIVTDQGGRTCHAAIVSRELGIPCIIGCGTATEDLKNAKDITIDCSSGEVGVVYEGKLEYTEEEIDLGALPKLRTKIAVNLANPSQAFETSFYPVHGVGLARMEFILASHIKVHPMAFIHPEKLTKEELKEVAEVIKGYSDGQTYFIEKLAEGLGTIAAAFYPERVIVRFSDFKTDEYAGLLGGSHFEPHESNPMIGWRGASRYYDDKYKEGFALECAAVKRVREDFGLDNLHVMIPFIRSVEEAKKVIEVMKENGLVQHENGLQVIGMCEVPSNVILADDFLDILDGYSIGSNDLTQLVLGVDRNSEIIQHLFDERNEAVKKFIAEVIKVAKRKKKYVGICGQAPSDFPDFAEFLVREGIESISLNPDSVLQTVHKLAEVEKSISKVKQQTSP